MLFDIMMLYVVILLGAGVLYTLVMVYIHGGAFIVEQNPALLIAEIVAVSLLIIIAVGRLIWKTKLVPWFGAMMRRIRFGGRSSSPRPGRSK